MQYRPFTVDTEVPVEHRMYPAFDSLLYFDKVLNFGIIDKKILEMRPFLSRQIHIRERRHEVHFLVS